MTSDYPATIIHTGVAPLAGLRPPCVPGLCWIAGWSGFFKLAERETFYEHAKNGTKRAAGALLMCRKGKYKGKQKMQYRAF